MQITTLQKDDVKRGEIYYISRGGYNTGSEQQADRPGVIVSNDKNNKSCGTHWEIHRSVYSAGDAEHRHRADDLDRLRRWGGRQRTKQLLLIRKKRKKQRRKRRKRKSRWKQTKN